MPLFFHNTLLPDDPTGMGVWLIEHYYEHLQFVQLGMQQSPVRFIPDYAIQSWSDQKSVQTQWLNVHQTIHDALRTWTGVQGIDLSTVDLEDREEWFEWMDAHAQEHILIEQALGLS
jgi:hypothetical protein